MPTNELPPEKRIASNLPDLPDLGHPPVPDPEVLENPEPDAVLGYPPQTQLLIEGFDPEEITVEFLMGLHDLGDENDLQVESVSVGQPGPDHR